MAGTRKATHILLGSNLLLIAGITTAVFGQCLENDLALYIGLFFAAVGLICFSAVTIQRRFHRR